MTYDEFERTAHFHEAVPTNYAMDRGLVEYEAVFMARTKVYVDPAIARCDGIVKLYGDQAKRELYEYLKGEFSDDG